VTADREHPGVDLVRQLACELAEAQAVADHLLGLFSRLHTAALLSADSDLRRMALAMHGLTVNRVRPIEPLTATDLAAGKSNTP
jgi:hypothetical protein